MAKFVTFDDGYANYSFRAIFPSKTPKKEIMESVRRKMKRRLVDRGLENDDFDWEHLNDYITIRNMKEGVFYEPEYGIWND